MSAWTCRSSDGKAAGKDYSTSSSNPILEGLGAVTVRRPSRSITTETLAKTLDQLDLHYRCCGYNPGKCPDTRGMVFASSAGSRDIAHDRYLCISD